MGKRKRWPNHVGWALEDTLRNCEKGIRAAQELLDISEDIRVVRRADQCKDAFTTIILMMERVRNIGPEKEEEE